MKAFSRKWDCPKCGAFAPQPDIDRRWTPAYICGKNFGDGEHLLWTCPECDYMERMACKDAMEA